MNYALQQINVIPTSLAKKNKISLSAVFRWTKQGTGNFGQHAFNPSKKQR